MSKTLQPSKVDLHNELKEDYNSSMAHVKNGIMDDTWNKGSRDEKMSFATDVFKARVLGHQLHQQTGIAQSVPTIEETNGVLKFDRELSSLENMKTQKSAVSKGLSRGEMAVRLFGDLGESKDKSMSDEFSV